MSLDKRIEDILRRKAERNAPRIMDFGLTNDPFVRALHEQDDVDFAFRDEEDSIPMDDDEPSFEAPEPEGEEEIDLPDDEPTELEAPAVEDPEEPKRIALFNTISEIMDSGEIERTEEAVRNYIEAHKAELGEITDLQDDVVEMFIENNIIYRTPFDADEQEDSEEAFDIDTAQVTPISPPLGGTAGGMESTLSRLKKGEELNTILEELTIEARTICAWCGKDLGEFEGEKDSHGICPECKEIEMEKLRKSRERASTEAKGRDEVQKCPYCKATHIENGICMNCRRKVSNVKEAKTNMPDEEAKEASREYSILVAKKNKTRPDWMRMKQLQQEFGFEEPATVENVEEADVKIATVSAIKAKDGTGTVEVIFDPPNFSRGRKMVDAPKTFYQELLKLDEKADVESVRIDRVIINTKDIPSTLENVKKVIQILKFTLRDAGVRDAPKKPGLLRRGAEKLGLALPRSESVNEQVAISKAATVVKLTFDSKGQRDQAWGALLQYEGVEEITEDGSNSIIVFTTDISPEEARQRITSILYKARLGEAEEVIKSVELYENVDEYEILYEQDDYVDDFEDDYEDPYYDPDDPYDPATGTPVDVPVSTEAASVYRMKAPIETALESKLTNILATLTEKGVLASWIKIKENEDSPYIVVEFEEDVTDDQKINFPETIEKLSSEEVVRDDGSVEPEGGITIEDYRPVEDEPEEPVDDESLYPDDEDMSTDMEDQAEIDRVAGDTYDDTWEEVYSTNDSPVREVLPPSLAGPTSNTQSAQGQPREDGGVLRTISGMAADPSLGIPEKEEEVIQRLVDNPRIRQLAQQYASIQQKALRGVSVDGQTYEVMDQAREIVSAEARGDVPEASIDNVTRRVLARAAG